MWLSGFSFLDEGASQPGSSGTLIVGLLNDSQLSWLTFDLFSRLQIINNNEMRDVKKV